MSIKIGSNLHALQAQRRLGETSSQLSQAFERLSSGQRINRASDDAAGLAIADSLNAKNRIYTRGAQNLNDGLSLLSIADGAITQLTNIGTRLVALAGQAANGTYSTTQRSAIDKEAQALKAEFSRITNTTSFNGLKLFDGSVQGLRLQAGTGLRDR